MRTSLATIAFLAGAAIELFWGPRSAAADQEHVYDEGPTYYTNASNPGHLWVGIGAANTGIVSSGGRYHDIDDETGEYEAPYTGNWAMDISGTGSITFYAWSAGQGQGPAGYPLINGAYPITIEARLAEQGGSDYRCKSQRWDVLATWTPIGQAQRVRDNIGWLTVVHGTYTYSTIGTIIPSGTTIGSVVYVDQYNKVNCNTGSHVHMEFSTNGNEGVAYEWHGEGPDWYGSWPDGSDHLHYWSTGSGCTTDEYYHGQNGACAPRDTVEAGTLVAFLGGDRLSSQQTTMWENMCYTRAAPYRALHDSASVSETSVKIFFADNSCDETHFEVYRKIGSTWSLRTTLAGDKAAGYTREYEETGLTPGTYYAYWVKAVNAYGGTWAGSYLTAITLSRPVAPQAVGAYGTSTSSIRVHWRDETLGGLRAPGLADGYIVTR